MLATKPIDWREINQSQLKALAKQPELLELIDQWILLADREHTPALVKASALLERIQPFARRKVWRGISPTSGYQDTMGLSKDWVLWKQALRHEVGDHFEYDQRYPLSFTTDLDIAKKFGSTIIEIDLTVLKNPVVWISDEVCALISERNNLAPQTLREVIVLPQGPLPFTIYHK